MTRSFRAAWIVALLWLTFSAMTFPQGEHVPNTTPHNCDPCLFYGGDYAADAPESDGLTNGRTLSPSGLFATVFVPFTVPNGEKWTVESLFVNCIVAGPAFAQRAGWSISTNMSSGSPGELVAQGRLIPKLSPTGRKNYQGYPEYTLAASLPKSVTLSAGQYWLSVVPDCIDIWVQACYHTVFYASDSLMGLNAYGPPEPQNQSLIYGYRYDFVETSTLGAAFSAFSAGVVGTASPAE
jgi:hypothetical protein